MGCVRGLQGLRANSTEVLTLASAVFELIHLRLGCDGTPYTHSENSRSFCDKCAQKIWEVIQLSAFDLARKTSEKLVFSTTTLFFCCLSGYIHRDFLGIIFYFETKTPAKKTQLLWCDVERYVLSMMKKYMGYLPLCGLDRRQISSLFKEVGSVLMQIIKLQWKGKHSQEF